ncbi:MAG: hypothetical protein EOO20_23885, partial [Chryseobacterium sp.]
MKLKTSVLLISLANYTKGLLTIAIILLFTGCAEKRQASQLLLAASPWKFAERQALSTLSPKNHNATFSVPTDSSSLSSS